MMSSGFFLILVGNLALPKTSVARRQYIRKVLAPFSKTSGKHTGLNRFDPAIVRAGFLYLEGSYLTVVKIIATKIQKGGNSQ